MRAIIFVLSIMAFLSFLIWYKVTEFDAQIDVRHFLELTDYFEGQNKEYKVWDAKRFDLNDKTIYLTFKINMFAHTGNGACMLEASTRVYCWIYLHLYYPYSGEYIRITSQGKYPFDN